MPRPSLNKPGSVRRKEILELLKQRESCSIPELGEWFGVSVPTIYRDINALADAQLIKKTHGGAMYQCPPPPSKQPAADGFEQRMDRQLAAKREIADKALSLLEEDDVVFFDSSTTVLHLARAVAATKRLRRLTIVTNSCPIIDIFPSFPPSITLINVGGTYHPQLHSFLGGAATKTVEDLRIGKLFFSAVGYTSGGTFTFHEDHALFLGQLAKRCQTVFLADSAKFGREALFKISAWESIHTFVSDISLPQEALESLGDGVRCVL